MTPKQRFDLIYAPQVKQHLRAIARKHHTLIRSKIEEQLQFKPDAETRNRKPLKKPVELGAEWEIRFGPDNRFRVFYEVDRDQGKVYILAVGVKRGNQLRIGGEEVEL
jgi:mRNA-degrading endonuclease RelE of RelBE toxin-antitoxin system